MSNYPPPSSPPPAHPSLRPSLASSSSSSSNTLDTSWSTPGSFYFTGSSAPPILNSRRAPPLKGRSSTHSSIRSSPALPHSPSASAPSPPVLLTDGVCVCCDSDVRYPRASASFRCTVCDVVNDLTEEQRRGKSREVVLPPDATPISETQFLSVVDRLRARAVETDEQLARRLAGIELGDPALLNEGGEGEEDEDDPEDLLVAYLVTAFNNLPSIDASFRPSFSSSSSSEPSRPARPTLSTLRAVYDLVKLRPAALEILRSQVEAVLRRPGPTLAEGDGGWMIVLLESPVFSADFNPDSIQRRWLTSRLIGLLSNLPNPLHHRLVSYLSSSSYPRRSLQDKVELVCSFLSWRIGEAANPSLGAPAGAGDYRADWMVRAGARVASLLFNANLSLLSPSRLPLSAFYVTLIDSLGESALVRDFTAWESGETGDEVGGFALCQYPFLMSLGVKMGLLGWDGERQMVERAREAYRSTFIRNELDSPILVLRVRREHLVSDSLRQISNNRINLKKTLRIAFEGEEGVDAGGLRKEWFLSLCRQLFDPQYGMFLLDPDSNLCWFNPASFETDDYWLVGVVLGLALYNMATLDVPLPSAVYKKLLSEPVSLSDLAQLNPSLARGLQQLLDFSPPEAVEDTVCRAFVGEYEAWGEVVEVELCEGGKERAVTGENREEYVRLLVDFHLSTSISSQFEAFASGFHEVCAGNALSLFKAAELELVVRGSDEPLEVDQLRAMTVYEGFEAGDPTIELFWLVFRSFSPADQRSLLAFTTASDRLPATGTSSLQLKVQCLGDDCDRLPSSHTCFNSIGVYRYATREKMERMLRRAMEESEGFGLR
ncbi:hypothetical protein JCM8097_005167 [Rhodosporidiobolus ruineniae]